MKRNDSSAPKLLIRVLHLGAEPTGKTLVESLLTNDALASFSLSYEYAFSLDDGIVESRLTSGEIDLVLLDIFNAVGQQTNILSHLCEQHPAVPVVVIGEDEGGEQAMDIFQQGAQDFIERSQLNRSALLRVIGLAVKRSRFEQALLHERYFLDTLIENVPNMIFAKDRQGHYSHSNAAHRAFVGIDSKEELFGKTVFDLFAPEMAREYDRADHLVMTSGVPLLNHKELITNHAGVACWYATTKVPLRDQHGQINGLVCIGRSIHQQKIAEDELKQANRDLSIRQAELHHALEVAKNANADLQNTQLQLIEAAKLQSVGRLAAGIAHEVKNPLGVLRMGVDFLSTQREKKDEGFATAIKEMTVAIERADRVIRELLDFASSKSLAICAKDLNAVIKRALWLVNYELRTAEVTVVRKLGEGLPMVSIDSAKIEQVMINIIINACHAMEKGGILTIKTFYRRFDAKEITALKKDSTLLKKGQDEVVIELKDTGDGISKDQLAALFEPFFTTKPAGKGNGLGLTVTKKIIEMHQGSISIRNHQQGGALVTICLPVSKEPQATQAND